MTKAKENKEKEKTAEQAIVSGQPVPAAGMVSADDPTGGHTTEKETDGKKDAAQVVEDKRVEQRKEDTDGPRPFPESEANVLGVARNQGNEDALTKRINESGLFYVKNHILEEEYVGISPQCDENAHPSSKAKSSVIPLTVMPPRTGMQVRLKDGQTFTIPDGFGLDTTTRDWGAVTNPQTGEPLFA